MKSFIFTFCLIAFAAMPPVLRAQNLNWGSAIYSDLVDSEGAVLDDSFIFQLGAFAEGFAPDGNNTSEWLSNWQVFDAADYNGFETPDDGISGYFTSTASMTDSGLSDSPDSSPFASSFEGKDAFLWIRNSNLDEPGSEWFLGRAGDWVFPMAVPGCCDNDGVLEWSTSDLAAGDTPVWGNQGGVHGGGTFTNSDGETLQTFTFVPEPSSCMLLMWLGAWLTFLRRRTVRVP